MNQLVQTSGSDVSNIQSITAQIITYKGVIGQSILAIGRLLIEAKAQLPHGEWLPWLTEQVDFSERAAQQFMQVARGYGYEDAQLVTELGLRKSIALLSVPAEEREAFIEEHDALSSSARELEAAVRARKQAEEERQIAEDSLKVANASLAGANAQLKEVTKELEDLKSRPTEVAVQTVIDQDAIDKAVEKARAQAVMEHQKEIADLQGKLAAAEKVIEENQYDEIADANAQIADLRAKLAIASNEDVAAVKYAFEQMKGLANQVLGRILNLQHKGQTEAENTCRTSLKALGQLIISAAESNS